MKQRGRNNIMLTLLLGAIMLPLGCERTDAQLTNEAASSETLQEGKTTAPGQLNGLIPELLDRLRQGKEIHPLMNSEIVFIFHSDDRCRGSTDGIIPKLPANNIDSPFMLKVINDGDGWACKKRDASEKEMEFDLKTRLAQWNRIEVSEHGQMDGPFYIEGGGESDYIVIHVKNINARDVIYKFEYRSEDPG